MISHFWTFPVILYAVIVGVAAVESIKEDDKIANLPGQPKVNFRQYAGYITIDEKHNTSFFYYFVEAETQAESKPLVLWLNGGPGCSSVGIGAFCEHGPFKPSGNVLIKNDYSWNKEANVLYLESPVGVGFSYSDNKSVYQSADDEKTAQDNLVFLKKWLKKFPEFTNRDFYITGESYGGGHYVPPLADLIIKSKAKFNLKGIAIGNPLLEFDTDLNAGAEFLWSHGLISDDTYELFNKVCNKSQIKRQSLYGNLTPECSRVDKQASEEMGKLTEPLAINLEACLSSASMRSLVLSVQPVVLNQLKSEQKIDLCVEDETKVYLNRDDVQKALHARLVGVSRWTLCSDVLQYEMQNYEIPTIGILGSLVKSGVHVLAYSGDQDAVFPLTGTRTLVNRLAKELGMSTTVPYSPWYEGEQVAGWTQAYGDFLSFATVKGGSHEPAFTEPERSLVLFGSFVNGKRLPQVNGMTESEERTQLAQT